VLLWIKLWSVDGQGTVRVTECIIFAFIWASNSRFQRHQDRSKNARNVCPTVQKARTISPNVFLMDSVHMRRFAI
jgi:hypothetical protein